ncbi:MAG TPA: outer membrane beta-barrel protein, partial [Hyphomicrobiales bacterium]|nr:outer membrane beta-barrel protein [Hyphomicrobiales bacterium]
MAKFQSAIATIAFAGTVAFVGGVANAGGYKDAPLPYVAAVNWSGAYGGFNVGTGWLADDGSALLSPSGGFAGGQIGYNWQGVFGMGPNWVLGVEADLQGSGIEDSSSGLKSSLNWFGTIRGRVGYAFGSTLVYATGGFAFGEVENTVFPARATETQTGYAVGGGVEYRFNPTWSIKGEYQFISLD